MLDKNCTTKDVQEADTETIWNSYHAVFKNESDDYPLEIFMEMANELMLRGL